MELFELDKNKCKQMKSYSFKNKVTYKLFRRLG